MSCILLTNLPLMHMCRFLREVDSFSFGRLSSLCRLEEVGFKFVIGSGRGKSKQE